MFRDRDFDPGSLPWNAEALERDLALAPLLEAMARGDELVHEVARTALLDGCANDRETVLHRQAIARDALASPELVRGLYALTAEALESKREHSFGVFGNFPASVLYGAGGLMRAFVGFLRRLRDATRGPEAAGVASPGLRTLFAMLQRELDDAYLEEIEARLASLRFPDGTLLSAVPGPGNLVRGHVLHDRPRDERGWLARLLSRTPPGLSFRLADRDEAGARALGEIRDRGIHVAADTLARSADHVEGFFRALRTELAFYVGCLNLHEALSGLGLPTAFPDPSPAGERRLRFRVLFDPCLALQKGERIVANSVDADGRSLVVVTGANQGGKSVFLRSVGVAQLMMQAGTFVVAESYEGELAPALATHYRREEDAGLRSGKLDEELARMSEVADHLAPDALVLFSESFAATNEREGSEIARQVVAALLARRVKVFFVTHLHDFARGLHSRGSADALFLRAEREGDGTRTFRLAEGAPLATSHGRDLFERIFGATA